MAKKKDPALTEEQITQRPTKQSFAKITKNKKKNPRTWVVIYRLVDGPAVNLNKSKKRKTARKKKAEKAK
jgi:hypothetical protein